MGGKKGGLAAATFLSICFSVGYQHVFHDIYALHACDNYSIHCSMIRICEHPY